MATNFDNFANESLALHTSSFIKTTVLEKDLTPSHLTLEDLLAETRQYLAPQDLEKIQRAYDLANQAHKGAVRRSGEPYIQHPLEVALLLADMRIDADGIVSALLHDVVEDTEYSLDDLAGKSKGEHDARKSADSAGGDEHSDMAPPALPSIADKRRERTETVRK